eukprot:g2378.t1
MDNAAFKEQLQKWEARTSEWHARRDRFCSTEEHLRGGDSSPAFRYGEALLEMRNSEPQLLAFLRNLSSKLRSAHSMREMLNVGGTNAPRLGISLLSLPTLRASALIEELLECIVAFLSATLKTAQTHGDKREERLRHRAQQWGLSTLKGLFDTVADREAAESTIKSSSKSGSSSTTVAAPSALPASSRALSYETMLTDVGKVTGTAYNSERTIAPLQMAEAAHAIAAVLDGLRPTLDTLTQQDADELHAATRVVSASVVKLLSDSTIETTVCDVGAKGPHNDASRENIVGISTARTSSASTTATLAASGVSVNENNHAFRSPHSTHATAMSLTPITVALLRFPPVLASGASLGKGYAQVSGSCQDICTEFLDKAVEQTRESRFNFNVTGANDTGKCATPPVAARNGSRSVLCLPADARVGLWLRSAPQWDAQVVRWVQSVWARPLAHPAKLMHTFPLRLWGGGVTASGAIGGSCLGRARADCGRCLDCGKGADGIHTYDCRRGGSLYVRNPQLQQRLCNMLATWLCGKGRGDTLVLRLLGWTQELLTRELESKCDIAALSPYHYIHGSPASRDSKQKRALQALRSACELYRKAAKFDAPAIASFVSQIAIFNSCLYHSDVTARYSDATSLCHMTVSTGGLHTFQVALRGLVDHTGCTGRQSCDKADFWMRDDGDMHELAKFVSWFALAPHMLNLHVDVPGIAINLQQWVGDVASSLRTLERRGSFKGVTEAYRDWVATRTDSSDQDNEVLRGAMRELQPQLIMAWLRGSRWSSVSEGLIGVVVDDVLSGVGVPVAHERQNSIHDARVYTLHIFEAFEGWACELETSSGRGHQRRAAVLFPLLHKQLARAVRWCHQKLQENHQPHPNEQNRHAEDVAEDAKYEKHDLDHRLMEFAAHADRAAQRQQLSLATTAAASTSLS